MNLTIINRRTFLKKLKIVAGIALGLGGASVLGYGINSFIEDTPFRLARRKIEEESKIFNKIISKLRDEGIIGKDLKIHYKYLPSNNQVGYIEFSAGDSSKEKMEKIAEGGGKNAAEASSDAREKSIRSCIEQIVSRVAYPYREGMVIIDKRTALYDHKTDKTIWEKCKTCSSSCKKYDESASVNSKTLLEYVILSSQNLSL